MTGAAAALPGCGSNSPVGPRPPSAPTELTATVLSATRIDLGWVDNAGNETSYEVERRLATESEFRPLATLDAGTMAYADESVVERAMYAYRVRAVSEGLVSDYSNEVEATTPAAGAPLTPLDVTIESVTTDGAIVSPS